MSRRCPIVKVDTAIATVVGVSSIKECRKILLSKAGTSKDIRPARPEEMILRRGKAWDVGGRSKA